MKSLLAFGIVIGLGAIGFLVADPFDGAAASTGATVFVDENDGVIDPTWTYRLLRAADWLSWVVGLPLGVGIAATLGLLKR